MDRGPLHCHLLDILRSPASSGLILGGGYGLQLKREHIKGQATLLVSIPEIRPTLDLDFFLPLEFFEDPERAQGVRALLDSLEYQPTMNHLQFVKPLGDEYPGRLAKIDLLARPPSVESRVKVKLPRVGSKTRNSLHGRYTPEAFAVEESTKRILVSEDPAVYVEVPHPFPWVVMKTVAAGDWLNSRGTEQAKPNGEKHAFDVYVLTAMVTQDELKTCRDFNQRYDTHEKMQEARRLASALFGSRRSPGFLEVCRRVGGELEYDIFWEGYQVIMGL